MTQLVGVPDPIHEELKELSKERDSTMGEIVREWKLKAEMFDQLDDDFFEGMQTRGDAGP